MGFALAIAGCSSGQDLRVAIPFSAAIDGSAFSCSGSTRGFAPSDLRFYVHDLALIDGDGRTSPIRLDDDGTWQSRGVALIDFENGQDNCRDGTAGTHTTLTGSVAAGDYRGLRFVVGVPFERNHADAATAGAPLNLGRMHWGWQGGYKFLRFEGSGDRSAFRLHLGSTGCEGTLGNITSCSRPNRASIELDAFALGRDGIHIELSALTGATTASPPSASCMAEQDKVDCRIPFAALGLDLHSGTPHGAQTLFSAMALRATDIVAANVGAPDLVPTGRRASAPDATWTWQLPTGFPDPRVPEDNPMSSAKVALGRHLFYDTALSANGTQACATCHQQQHAFTDGRAHAVGSTGELHHRGSMTLANVAYASRLTWASHLANRLEKQALIPMFGDAPIELGLPDESVLVGRLQQTPRYPPLFAEAYPHETQPISIRNVTHAIAAFERTLISGNSPYDRYTRGDAQALSPSAKRGMTLFFSERLECFHCHGGFTFTDSIDHAALPEPERAFHNTGLYNLDGAGAYPESDRGMYDLTADPADMGRFKAPTLRNIAVTAPYMHDGSIATLAGVIDHYAAGGRKIEQGTNAGDGSESPLKDKFLVGFLLTAAEHADLIAFLESLTDRDFLNDPRFAAPLEASREL